MSNVFVLAETQAGARELCAGARSIAEQVICCIVGTDAVPGVADRCIHIDVPKQNIIDDAYLSVIKAFESSDSDVVFAEQTLRMLSLVGRLAAAEGASAITGVTSMEGDAATSMYYGGTGTRAARPIGNPKIYVLNPGTFDAAGATGTEIIEELPFEAPAVTVKKIGEEPIDASDVDLASAERVVACGRGFGAEEDLQLARELAGKIGAELACTRPLAEGEAWFSRESYIGVSGKFISPDLYFCIGISGQMQHMVGCNAAGTIVAINKDKNAPVFKMCDFGIVGDLKTVLPELVAAL